MNKQVNEDAYFYDERRVIMLQMHKMELLKDIQAIDRATARIIESRKKKVS